MTTLRQAAQQALEALEAITRSVQSDHQAEIAEDAITALRTALEQQAEPVAWVCMNGEKHDIDFDQPEIDAIPVGTFLYTTPPQRQWVGLTDEDCKRMSAGDKLVAMWADRTLKERNGY